MFSAMAKPRNTPVWYFRISIIVIMFVVGSYPAAGYAQTLSPDELMRLLNLAPDQIDTLLRQKNFLLLHRETDSASRISYYSSVERNTTKPTWVRSLSFSSAAVGNRQGKMVNYRTYDREEYDRMLSWFLQQNYKTEKQFQFGRDQHTIYSNEKESIRIKVGIAELPDHRKTWVYEWEAGR